MRRIYQTTPEAEWDFSETRLVFGGALWQRQATGKPGDFNASAR
jgi:hypothetical protein